MIFELKIKPTSPEIEYSNLWNVISRLPFYREHGYYPILPKDVRFMEVAVMSPSFPKGIKNKLSSIFSNEIYNPISYNLGENKLENEIKNVYPAFSKIVSDCLNWGFKIFPTYEISITKYGVGGNCNEKTGSILLVIDDVGDTLVRNASTALIHEMVHIGIGEEIVSKYKLSHDETEQLVDWICSLYIPDYWINDRFGNTLKEYLKGKSVKNLPQNIEEYKQNLT
ncbi:hypothetical protein HYV12_01655 [Candidatus Dojkabacteria bacterium]|nr:hypothetical protein [Candidatus Dojkabacteria bacterium]